MQKTDVAIVGAGPNGLALSVHLNKAGVEHVVFGQPFSLWHDHMPRGMFLKSEPYGSDVAAPVPGYRVGDFCRATGAEYVNRGKPLSLETFLAYADWFTSTLVPDVHRSLVTSVKTSAGGFVLAAEDGSELAARRVVVATGLVPFAHVPAVLGSLPSDLVSHTSGHSDLTGFRGRRVGLIGSGQSALETAALLHEVGAEVEVIARGPEIRFHTPKDDRSGMWSRVRHPRNPLCEGVKCLGYFTFPDLFRALPEPRRLQIARTFLGPEGSAWIRPRVEGHVQMRAATRVIEARPVGSQLMLVLDGKQREEVLFDHVMAGTGFRTDIERLGFLSSDLRKAVAVAGGAPVLSRSFESSVTDLFFLGSMAAPSLGPSMRFLSGTHFTAKRLTRRLRSQQGPKASAGTEPAACVDLSTPVASA